jgi:hypothetical protein
MRPPAEGSMDGGPARRGQHGWWGRPPRAAAGHRRTVTGDGQRWAASYRATTAVGMRPRSLTSMPMVFAQARTLALCWR